jgi:hypothetical protein
VRREASYPMVPHANECHGTHFGPVALEGDRAVAAAGTQAWAASSSDATFLTRLGSTWMPGPIVVETVIFLM